MELREAEFQKSADELKITASSIVLYIGDKEIRVYIELITMVETRLREAVKGLYINFRSEEEPLGSRVRISQSGARRYVAEELMKLASSSYR